MKRLLFKILTTVLAFCVVLALFTACDEEQTPSPPPTGDNYSYEFVQNDGIYKYEIKTNGAITLSLSIDDEKQWEMEGSIANGKYIFYLAESIEGEQRAYSFDVSGETLILPERSFLTGFTYPYSQASGTYSVVGVEGATMTFNADGTGSTHMDREGATGVTFTYYAVDGNRAILKMDTPYRDEVDDNTAFDELIGYYYEFTDEGISPVGTVYNPNRYVYYNTIKYGQNIAYSHIVSHYGATRMGIYGNTEVKDSTLYYKDGKAFRVDDALNTDSDEYELQIFFGDYSEEDGVITFSYDCESGSPYYNEGERGEDIYYTAEVYYERIVDQWGDEKFDYLSEKVEGSGVEWNDYYFGYSTLTSEQWNAAGLSCDFNDGYKTLRQDSVLGMGDGEHYLYEFYVFDAEEMEVKYIFYEYDSLHYEGCSNEYMLERKIYEEDYRLEMNPNLKEQYMFIEVENKTNLVYLGDGFRFELIGIYSDYDKVGNLVFMGAIASNIHNVSSSSRFFVTDIDNGTCILGKAGNGTDNELDAFRSEVNIARSKEVVPVVYTMNGDAVTDSGKEFSVAYYYESAGNNEVILFEYEIREYESLIMADAYSGRYEINGNRIFFDLNNGDDITYELSNTEENVVTLYDYDNN